jgi:hypothetical protein
MADHTIDLYDGVGLFDEFVGGIKYSNKPG